MCCGPSFPVATAFLVVVVLSMAAHTVEGWVLGARTSPFSNLEPVGSRRLSATEGNDFAARFRLADLSGPGKTSGSFYQPQSGMVTWGTVGQKKEKRDLCFMTQVPIFLCLRLPWSGFLWRLLKTVFTSNTNSNYRGCWLRRWLRNGWRLSPLHQEVTGRRQEKVLRTDAGQNYPSSL